MSRLNKQQKMTIQLWMAVIMSLSGMVLLYLGFWIDPEGQIHDSVLIAFGEIMTFVGALLGVDYTYRFKMWFKSRYQVEDDDIESEADNK